MARIEEGVLRKYNPGDRMTDVDYQRDREIFRVSINDLEDKYQLLQPENVLDLKEAVELAKTDDEGVKYPSLKDRLDSEKITTNEKITNTFLEAKRPNFPVTLWAKLNTKETGVASTFPVVRIEGDSLGEGSGASNGTKKWHYKLFVPDSTIEYINGRVGQNLSLANKFNLGTSITCNRNAIGGSTSPLALARIAAHVYKPDPTYSTSDILDKVNDTLGCDVLILSYGNNDFAAEVGMNRMKWFLEETIRAARGKGIDVLLICPHDRATGTVGSRILDRNSLKQAQDIILSLAQYYGCSVLDMRARFRQLIDDGIESAETLYPYDGDEFGNVATDNVHTNSRGQEYYALEFLNLMPSPDEVKITNFNKMNNPLPRIYRQPSFFTGVNRWKLIFDNEATFTTAATVAYGNTVNYPTTRSILGKPDTYWKLEKTGDKVRFRGIGSSFGILFMRQPNASTVTVKHNGAVSATINLGALSEKEYLYFVGNNFGTQTTLNIDVEWVSGVIGVSGVLFGSARDPHHLASHSNSFVSYVGTWTDNMTFKETTTLNDSLSASFIGTGLCLDLPTGTDYCQISISVDGGAPNTLDLYTGGAVSSRIHKIVSGLSYGYHTVTLTVTGKNAASSGHRLKVRNYRAIDERLDADFYETIAVPGTTLYIPEDRQGVITSADSIIPGQIGLSTSRQKYRTSLST